MDTKENIEEYLRTHEECSNIEIATSLGIPISEVDRVLKDLEEEGLIVSV